jgi:AcrR family transcriptional regulator
MSPVPRHSAGSSIPTAGRPRSAEAQRAVLNAARELFEAGGYKAATIHAVAARSGVAKTTIYRWWHNRASLLVEVLAEVHTAAVPLPAAGEPVRALVGELRDAAAAANGLTGKLMTALIAEAQHDPEVHAELLDGLFYPRRATTARVIRRAQEIGSVRPDVPPDVVADLLFGPLFYRLLVRHDPVTKPFMMQVFRCVMDGLAVKPRGRTKPKRQSKGVRPGTPAR